MSDSRILRRYAPLILAVALGAVALPAWADGSKSSTYRRYDEKGKFTGTARESGAGHLRFYDSTGQLTGTARREADGNWRLYDTRGQFHGIVRKEK